MPSPVRSAKAAASAAWAAAAMLGVATPAAAQDGGHPLDSTLEMLDLKTRQGDMPDFVTQSRGARSGDDYMPIGSQRPTRDLKPKSAAEVKALTAELDAARDAQLAGKRPKPMADGAPARPRAADKAGTPVSLRPPARQATNR